MRVTGPGFSRGIKKTTTPSDPLPGAYTIRANGFSTGLPDKPTYRVFTPSDATGNAAVTAARARVRS